MTNQEKIATANDMLDTLKDYIELLKVEAKIKQSFNAIAIKDQIMINEYTINENAKSLME